VGGGRARPRRPRPDALPVLRGAVRDAAPRRGRARRRRRTARLPAQPGRALPEGRRRVPAAGAPRAAPPSDDPPRREGRPAQARELGRGARLRRRPLAGDPGGARPRRDRRLQRLVDDEREVLPRREVRARRARHPARRLQRAALHVVGRGRVRDGVRDRPCARADAGHRARGRDPRRRCERRRVLPRRDAVALARARPRCAARRARPAGDAARPHGGPVAPRPPGDGPRRAERDAPAARARRARRRGVPRGPDDRLGRRARGGRALHAGMGRADRGRAGGAHRRRRAALRARRHVARDARARHRAQLTRRRQLPRLHQHSPSRAARWDARAAAR
jgi:hypothetical protein